MVERSKLIAMVQGAQQGNDEDVAALYDTFYNDIYYHIMKTVSDTELAADLTQDTFMEILMTIQKLEEPAAFVTWAKQIAYHRCTAYFRKSREVLVDEDEDGYSVFETVEEEREEFIPGEALAREDLKRDILAMIDALPEDQRSALLMRYYQEISVKDIAQIQGVSEGTVKSRLNYARKAIKQSVEAYEKKNGIKLHCSVLPLLLWLLYQYRVEGVAFPFGTAAGTTAGVAGAATGTATATATTTTATATATTATATATTATATATTAATATVAATAAGTATATGATVGTAAAAGSALAVKIAAGVIAAVVAVGGTTMAIIGGQNTTEKTNPTAATSQTDPTSPTIPTEAPEEPTPEPEQGGLLEYTLSEDGTSYEITGIGTFRGSQLIIPESYEGLPVVAIRKRAFYECNRLKSVVIPATMKTIGDGAFQLCENLESVTLPEGIETIESGAFSKCYGLTEVHIPASVTSIGTYAFDMGFGIQQITVAAENPVYHSDGNCLIETANKTIIAACSNSVIPTDGSVIAIGEGGFNGYGKDTLTLPDCITTLGTSAFSGSIVKEVTIPGSVETLDHFLFSGCTDLAVVRIEEGVTEIRYSAFSYCISLHTLYIPASVSFIEWNPVDLCESLADVYYAGTKAQWQELWGDHPIWFTVHCSDGDVYPASDSEGLTFTLSDDGTYYIMTKYSNNGRSRVVVPGTYQGLPVREIGNDAFSYCKNLKEVILLPGVTAIKATAFLYCDELETVVLPDTMRTIHGQAFYDCTNLSSINLPEGLERLGQFAFHTCSIKSLHIPSTVTEIDDGALAGCAKLEQLTVAEGNPVYHSAGNCLIETATGHLICGSITSQIPDDGSVTDLNHNAFCSLEGLTQLHIPASITNIELHSIYSNPNLAVLTVDPDNPVYHSAGNCVIETASKTLVVGCHTSVIPADGSVTDVADGVFHGQTKMPSFTFPEGVTHLGSSLFYDSRYLTQIWLPVSLVSIYNTSFEYCHYLTDIYYAGTMAQWNELTVLESPDSANNTEFIIHCTDGDIPGI